MNIRNPQDIGQKLLLAFVGKQFTSEMKTALEQYRPAGITLFRAYNIDSPIQLKQLTDDLQRHADLIGLPPLLIAADQEGGQLMAIGNGTTPLPGNMALGATASKDLARQAGEVLGRELAAMGVNVDYAPCCDVNINPKNPVIGTRSFGEDPLAVADLSAAMIAGIQSQGVAAVAKHFPGHGDTTSDSHLGLPSVPHDLNRLNSVELPPFQAAIKAGVQMVMSAHLALPALDGAGAPPATLSGNILQGLLRNQLGFDGVIVSDAMDMRAIQQGSRLGEECVKAAMAGIDLLLITADPADHRRAFAGLKLAAEENPAAQSMIYESTQRIKTLKNWLLSRKSNDSLDVVGCEQHIAVAREIAEKSVTLMRDELHQLPINLSPDQRILVILPRPMDLTPADTSSYISPRLAEAIRRYHANVEEVVIPFDPDESFIQAVLEHSNGASLTIFATLNAFQSKGQTALAQSLIQTKSPLIIAALRMPYDLAMFPAAGTFLCTYSIQEPSLEALAAVLFGKIHAQGRLPVSIPGLYPTGFRLD